MISTFAVLPTIKKDARGFLIKAGRALALVLAQGALCIAARGRSNQTRDSGCRIRDRSSSEAFAIPQRDCDPVTERIQKIVFSFVVLVADPKAFDLVAQVIA